MRHLQTKREATERRRVALMSRGIANFLERTARVTDPTPPTPSPREPESTSVPTEMFSQEEASQVGEILGAHSFSILSHKSVRSRDSSNVSLLVDDLKFFRQLLT